MDLESVREAPSDANLSVVPILLLCVVLWAVLLTPVVIWLFQRTAVAQATLKLEMVRRGMSAEEIELVMRAGSGPKADADAAAPPPKLRTTMMQPMLHTGSPN